MTARLNAAAGKSERQWQRLCRAYLPIQHRKSIWRLSRSERAGEPSQGWKLHVSATILSACDIFRAIAPYLRRRDVLFKAPKSLAELDKLNAGVFYGFSQVGKFITVYPELTKEAVEIAQALDALTAKFAAPMVPYDEQLRDRSCIFYRYGGFSDASVNFRGKSLPAIRRPDGKLVPDARKPRSAIPRWLTDPFKTAESRTALEPVTPLETDYSDYAALVQRGRGGLYVARHISSARSRRCAIKEGRRHGETDWLGRDGFDRIKREAEFLRATSSIIPAVPRIITTFHANGCFYLTMERIRGRSLHQVLASRERISRRRLLNYCASMAEIVADIHAAGWAWRDCKPANFLCQKNGKLRALDFEAACRLRAGDPMVLRTSGYVPRRGPKKTINAQDIDLYALGTSIMQLIARSNYPTRLNGAFEREIRKRKLPRQVGEMLRGLRSQNVKRRPSARTVQRLFQLLLDRLPKKG
jgi:tRNA A-37 threonylcarbamoyl transferase component Bud32